MTPHAVRRYQERVEAVPYELALARLIDEMDRAHLVREIGPGVELWRGGRPRQLRFRVSRRGHGLPQLVTVLRAHDRC